MVYAEGLAEHIPTRPLEVADPTGAGDEFMAAYLSFRRSRHAPTRRPTSPPRWSSLCQPRGASSVELELAARDDDGRAAHLDLRDLSGEPSTRA